MSSGRARSALSESLLGRVSQHSQAQDEQAHSQSVSVDITPSPRASTHSSDGEGLGRPPVHSSAPRYGSPWPHLLRAGQATSFPQVGSHAFKCSQLDFFFPNLLGYLQRLLVAHAWGACPIDEYLLSILAMQDAYADLLSACSAWLIP